MMISLVGSGPRRRSSSRFSARWDSGSLVSATSVVRPLARRVPIATTEATMIAAQAATTSQGRRGARPRETFS